MSLFGVAADALSGLEVKSNQPGNGAPEGASPSVDPGAETAPAGPGNPPSGSTGEPDDRKPLDRASEALKRARRSEQRVDELSASLAEMNRTNQALMQRILQIGQQPTAPAAPSKQPYPLAEIAQMQANGEWEKAEEAREDNARWKRDQERATDTATLEQTLEKRRQEDLLRTYLLTNLGLGGDEKSPTQQEIKREAAQVRARMPMLDEVSALAIAAGNVYRRAAAGEIELEDLRTETNARTAGTPGQQPETAREPIVKIDWDAPSRGLPPQIAAKLTKFRLGHTLRKHQDPTTEQHYRDVVESVLAQEQANARRRKTQGY